MTSIIFVHLNSRIPKYLKLNIQFFLKKFPNRKIVLIHNQTAEKWSPKGLVLYNYKGSKEILNLEKLLGHPREFRGNFWFTSIARFDAIREYIEKTGEPIIHIESDVIVSTDFPFDKFDSQRASISYPIVAINRGIASTLFIRDLDSAKLLVSSALECVQANSNTTDMEILSYHEKVFNRQVTQLAFASADEKSFHSSSPLPNFRKLGMSIKHFEGIFDGNDIGVYLFGTDPRNRRGFSLLRSEVPNNFASPKKWDFIFDRDRNFLSLKVEEGVLPIYSVHATCKQLFLFWQYSRLNIIKKRVKSQQKPPQQIFYPSIFCVMAIVRLFRKKNVEEKLL